MKRSLMRPTDVLLPLAGIAACVFGNTYAPFNLFFFYYMLQVFSLCAVDSFRNAAAREPGVRRVDRRLGGAILPLLFGISLSLLLFMFIAEDKTEFINEIQYIIPAFGSAVCVIIEQLFEERMHAIGKSVDVVMMSVISSALLFGGMMLDMCWELEPPLDNIFTFCGAALGMLISIIASLAAEPLHGFSLVPRNLGFIPKAAVQSLLYPVTMCVMMLMQIRRGDNYIYVLEEYLALPLIIGLIPWRLSRTVCRRSSDESRPLNLLLTGLAALAIIVNMVFELEIIDFRHAEIFHICSEGLVLTLICGAIVFCAPGVRFYIGTALIAIACNLNRFYIPYAEYIAMGMCLIAVGLNLKKAFLRRV